MKRFKLLLLTLICTLAAQAQYPDDGYYRVRSSVQKRYVRVIDNTGSVNVQTTDADLGALCTQRSWDKVVSEPASIIYIKKIEDPNGYDLQSQGTGSYEIIKYAVKALPVGDGKYRCYAQKGTMVKYIADQEIIDYLATEETRERGAVVTNITDDKSELRNWDLIPVDAESDNYFGLQPSIKVGNDYYQTFYASFPFTFASAGMSSWYISKVNEGRGEAIIEEVTGGVPAATPVIIKSTAQEAENNKLNVGADATGSAPNNQLKGVYFCNPLDGDPQTNHYNAKVYDPTTMRVLGKASDGSLAFVKDVDLKYIPSNTAYITVSASAPAVFKVVTPEEAAIQSITVDSKNGNIYDLQGREVTDNQLSRGVYIMNGRKYVVK
jgi:hypothetical protein